MFVDSHCHLDKITAQGIEQTLAQARAAQVERMLCVSVTLPDYREMLNLVGEHPQISVSCGVHPLYVAKHDYEQAELAALARDPRVVAIGETGLDYYYDKDSISKQQQSFAYHVELSNELAKPLIIHTRDAEADTLAILRNGHAEQAGGVLHCFTERYEMAKMAIDELDFFISISGIASFANAKTLRETIKKLPLDKLLIETDSPWLAPVPHRGKENQPAYVPHVAQCVADVKGISIEEVARVTTANFYRLFNAVKA